MPSTKRSTLVRAASALTLVLLAAAVLASSTPAISAQDALSRREKRQGDRRWLNSAETAANAEKLDGADSSAFVKGCAPGSVRGTVTIPGSNESSTFPSTYTSSTPYVLDGYNCAGQAIEARRIGTGAYYVRFRGLSSPHALIAPRLICCQDYSFHYFPYPTPEGTAFYVQTFDSSAGTNLDMDFTLAVV